MQLNFLTLPSLSVARRKVLPFLPILLSLAGCGVGVDITPIAELERFGENTEAIVRGTTVDRAPFVDGGAYQLQDETGTVWVVSDDTLPELGQPLQVTGQFVERSIPINGVDYGEAYLEEIDRQPTEKQ
ncbi:hypothetical protein [Baaleninema simplex]|uniref:hypothetical protein n=1 Tax=Baaleninema simplex TaxID=2862350 RepID=UPI000347D3B2|nr:hypothetical protein [Baaleninema simplex]